LRHRQNRKRTAGGFTPRLDDSEADRYCERDPLRDPQFIEGRGFEPIEHAPIGPTAEARDKFRWPALK